MESQPIDSVNKKLIELCVVTTAAGVLYSISTWNILLNFVCEIILPITGVYLILSISTIHAILPVLLSIVIVTILGGMPLVFSFILKILVGGIIMGLLIKRHVTPSRVIYAAALPTILLLFLSLLPTTDGQRVITTQIYEDATQMFEFYRQILLTEQELESLRASFNSFVALIVNILPSIFVLTSVFVFLCVYLISQTVLPKLGLLIPKIQPFSLWKSQYSLVWLFIIALVGKLILHDSTTLSLIALNLLVITTVIYFVQGLSIYRYLLLKRNVGVFVQILLFCLIIVLLQPFSFIITASVGLFDTWFNFRKLEKEL